MTRRRSPRKRARYRASVKHNARTLVELAHLLGDEFQGDFTDLARQMGWTSGNLWERNLVICLAAKEWTRIHRSPT